MYFFFLLVYFSALLCAQSCTIPVCLRFYGKIWKDKDCVKLLFFLIFSPKWLNLFVSEDQIPEQPSLNDLRLLFFLETEP